MTGELQDKISPLETRVDNEISPEAIGSGVEMTDEDTFPTVCQLGVVCSESVVDRCDIGLTLIAVGLAQTEV